MQATWGRFSILDWLTGAIVTHQQYVCGIFNLSIIAGLETKLIGSRLSISLRNLLIKSPNPCQVSISTRMYDMKLVMVASVLEDWIFANGWGNC